MLLCLFLLIPSARWIALSTWQAKLNILNSNHQPWTTVVQEENSWHLHVWPLLLTRTIALALLGIMIFIVLFFSFPTRSASNEEIIPAKLRLAFTLVMMQTPQLRFSLGILRAAAPVLCGFLGFRPFGEEIYRTFCDNQKG